jgi:hypothetical protein
MDETQNRKGKVAKIMTLQIGYRTGAMLIIAILVICLGLACAAVMIYKEDISNAGAKSTDPIMHPNHIKSEAVPVPELPQTAVPGILMGVVGAATYVKGRSNT